MKQFGRFLFAIGSALGLCFVGSATASLLMSPQTDGPQIRQVDVTDLWTIRPVRVDPSRQNSERLASIAPVDPPALPRPAAPVVQKTAVIDGTAGQPSEAHVAWCANRYRSYDPGSNTYRSYTGTVRTCVSPHMDEGRAASSPAGLSQAHMSWCAARYRSYRAQDNTYRSYSGEQRDCLSPFLQDG